MTEVWKSITGYVGIYEVSNLGRVRSVNRNISTINNGTLTTRKVKSKILKTPKNSSGYAIVSLSKNNTVRSFSVHRLVAIEFLEFNDNRCMINHIDGNKLNNIISNLEWCTQSENMKHAFKIGLKKNKHGELSNLCKYSDEKVIKMVSDYSSGDYNYTTIAKKHGMSRQTASDIINGKKRKYLNVQSSII